MLLTMNFNAAEHLASYGSSTCISSQQQQQQQQ
jgi:hypothetical protein